ncbi:DNA binding protein [Blastocystis sp. subtype 4]|uniref:DNA binding protein n=1 Tax=Blastocystis sp. subtype 4 TaxID=944170 RepID=UPI0007112B57|nr:DNA binding protein [Blastocystis sp. subtype 4]KNB42599.1 DNA binding protein [Blastocystis sp. subtype 4]|eukprot:XP_014526042.1 DNA binding protein [Blastocystis sp. subtype 4]
MSAPASNPEGEKNKESIFFGSYRFADTVTVGITDGGKGGFTMGGVKKPKFKPVAKKAAAAHRIDSSSFSPLSPPPVVTAPSQAPEPLAVPTGEETKSSTDGVQNVKVKREDKVRPRRNDEGQRPNRQSQRSRPPPTLVSGESRFFATNSNRRPTANAMDNAFLMSRQMESRNGVKREDSPHEMEVEEPMDDQELTEENNGPIRFPYVDDEYHARSHDHMSWDEDDTQVTPLELLQGVNDGDMLLFALPSFLPIYAQNREYGIDEEAFIHNNSTKPHEYIENELKSVPPGRIGTMCVHESGRISVNINGYIVDMNVSIPVRYQQQVATIDESSVNLLGNVKHRLVLTPDIHNYQ